MLIIDERDTRNGRRIDRQAEAIGKIVQRIEKFHYYHVHDHVGDAESI